MSERIGNFEGSAATEEKCGEEREGVRRRTLKAGKLVYNDANFTLDCTVRDFSESGAKLRFDRTAADAPDTFMLCIDLDGTRVECEVMWRRGRELGVRFIGPIDYVGEKRRQTLVESETRRPRGSLLRKPLRQ